MGHAPDYVSGYFRKSFQSQKVKFIFQEIVMTTAMTSPFRKALLVSILAGICFVVACGSSVEGKYRDPSGTINAEFKDGKAYIALGAYAVDGTYKIEGDKIIASGDFGLMLPSPTVFTINKDGSIDGPRSTMIPRLEKVK
jgi:hypothetical protein